MLTNREIALAVRRFASGEEGATAIEYGLIAFAVGTVLVLVLPGLSNSSLWEVFDSLVSALADLTNR